jgi:cobalt-zinc-cadmium efflux system membrane fusion protein
MASLFHRWGIPAACLAAVLTFTACARGHAQAESGAPPSIPVDEDTDGDTIRVDHPERFPMTAAVARDATSDLSVTGVVAPDVSRAIPVVSLASGRVVDVRVRLGDTVRKGQLLMRIHSADVASAFADYRKAGADETLARTQFERAQTLFERGAIAKKDLEVARDAHDKATVDRETAAERLRVLGVGADDPPTGVIDITAPASGVITEQNVTPSAGVKSLDNSPNLFTISDLSHVWILCDVYENDLPHVRVGDPAEIRLSAYPDRTFAGRIGNVGPILDPAIRTAKVRVEIANPGVMRVGMFVTATFHGQAHEVHAVVPASAILHLHDRDWVYVPTGDGRFRREEVVAGPMRPGQLQDVVSGLHPGDRVVTNALVLQNSVEQ